MEVTSEKKNVINTYAYIGPKPSTSKESSSD